MTPRKENYEEEDSEKSNGNTSNDASASSGNTKSSSLTKSTKKLPPQQQHQQQHHPFSTLLFPMKLHRILSGDIGEGGARSSSSRSSSSGECWDDLISWSPDGKSFRIHDKKKFEKEITKKYFGTPKLSKFKINLMLWGFTNNKTSTNRPNHKDEEGEWFHPLFRRDRPDLCIDMQRGIMSAKQHNYHRHGEKNFSDHSATSSTLTPVQLASATVQTEASGIADNRTSHLTTLNGNSTQPSPPAFAGITGNSFSINLNCPSSSQSTSITTSTANSIRDSNGFKDTCIASRSHGLGGAGYLNHPQQQGYSSSVTTPESYPQPKSSKNLSDPGPSSTTTTDDSDALLSALSLNDAQLAKIILSATRNLDDIYQQNGQQERHHASLPAAGSGMNGTNNFSTFKNNHKRSSADITETISGSTMGETILPSKQLQSSSPAQAPSLLQQQQPEHGWESFPNITKTTAFEVNTMYQENNTTDNNAMGQHQPNQNANMAPQQGEWGECWTEEMKTLALLGFIKRLYQELVATCKLSSSALETLSRAATETAPLPPQPQPSGATAARGYPVSAGASSNIYSLVNHMLTRFLANSSASMNGYSPTMDAGRDASPDINSTGNTTASGTDDNNCHKDSHSYSGKKDTS